jgi:NTP pyrophosphatase (non-canonical NTP hydrolase)
MKETFYLYHIPGKKIGVTRDLNRRVTRVQGYKPGEYEVLESSTDIDYISKKELELQKSYGYKRDIKLYKNLFKMKINVTEQTTTFPCPVTKLKGRLHDEIGRVWQTEHGKFVIDSDTIKWIMDNVHTSMFNNERCYIYNKALSEWFNKQNSLESLVDHIDGKEPKEIPTTIFDNIRDWAKVRGIYKNGDAKTQYVKLQEESGELAKALLKNDKAEIVDAIGDMIIVLTNLAEQKNVRVETCIASAYNQIAERTGKMINGTFVKDER